MSPCPLRTITGSGLHRLVYLVRNGRDRLIGDLVVIQFVLLVSQLLLGEGEFVFRAEVFDNGDVAA